MTENYPPFATAEDEYKKDHQLKREDVQALLDWISKQAHIPEISEMKMIIFLHCNYYKIEATKQCIEHYFTIRAHCDEMFANHDISTQIMQKTKHMMLCHLLKSEPEHKVMMLHIYDPNTDLMRDIGPIFCFLDIMTQLAYARTGTSDGHIVITDGSNLRFGHIIKISLMVAKIYMFYVQFAMPIRLKGIYVVNISPAIEKLYVLFKPFIKGNMMEALHMFSSHDELKKHLPMHCIPKELGGDGPTYAELHDDQCKTVEAYAKYVQQLGLERADESRRQKKIDFGDMFGYEGTFKKLQID